LIIENRNLRDKSQIFPTRIDAGKQLAKLMEGESIDAMLIIPNGGIPIGLGILQRKMFKPEFIDLLIVKKIQVPWSTESGMGAITPDGELFLNEQLISHYDIKNQAIKDQVEKTMKRIKEIKVEFDISQDLDVAGKSILIVDDGIASGFSMLAGVNWLMKKGASKIIISVPTAPERSLNILEYQVEKLYCVNIRTGYSFAVADAYKNWYDLSLTEAIDHFKKIKKLIG